MFAELDLIVKGRKAFRSPKKKSGVYCTFMKMNDKYGIKLYNSEEIRDTCYDRQNFAAEHDLAPKTGQKFEFSRLYCWKQYDCVEKRYNRGISNEKIYGFVTEIVVIHSELTVQDKYGCSRYLDACDNLNMVLDALTAIGMKPGDTHCDNYGWNEGGMVVTDFSHFD